MKKILSLCMTIMLTLSMFSVGYALSEPCDNAGCTDSLIPCPNTSIEHNMPSYCPTCNECGRCGYSVPQTGSTIITLVGTGTESYTVTVPANLAPGQSGTVTASGTWESSKKLTVSCPDSVELTYGEQTMDVDIAFAGIELEGNDLAAVNITEQITIESATALFGTWVGVLNYDVELTPKEPPVRLMSFRLMRFENSMMIEDNTYNYIPGMTWEEWVDSDYNTAGLIIVEDKYVQGHGGSAYTLHLEGSPAVQLKTDTIIDNASYVMNQSTGQSGGAAE